MLLGTAALLWMLAATGDGGQDRHKRPADTDEPWPCRAERGSL